jgi:putative ABC transport system permease protein
MPGPNPTIPGSGRDLITITSLNQLVEEADKANRVMTLLLGGIAAVSLLVGGLGIMNIMLVAVTERTEEIGIRRALGAKQGDLLTQFLLEALYLSAIGAIAGTAGGLWGLNLFGRYGFETAVSFQAIKVATIVALTSGLLFGIYPAISASSVMPVKALRRQ